MSRPSARACSCRWADRVLTGCVVDRRGRSTRRRRPRTGDQATSSRSSTRAVPADGRRPAGVVGRGVPTPAASAKRWPPRCRRSRRARGRSSAGSLEWLPHRARRGALDARRDMRDRGRRQTALTAHARSAARQREALRLLAGARLTGSRRPSLAARGDQSHDADAAGGARPGRRSGDAGRARSVQGRAPTPAVGERARSC